MAIESTPEQILDSARLPQESTMFQAIAQQAYAKDSSNILPASYSSLNDSSYLPGLTVSSEGENPTSTLSNYSQDVTAPGPSSYSDGTFIPVGIVVSGDPNAAKGEQGLPIPNAQNGDMLVHNPAAAGVDADPGMVIKPTDSPPVDTTPAPNNGTGDTGPGNPIVANPDPELQIDPDPDSPEGIPALSLLPPQYTASIGGASADDAVGGGGNDHVMEMDS